MIRFSTSPALDPLTSIVGWVDLPFENLSSVFAVDGDAGSSSGSTGSSRTSTGDPCVVFSFSAPSSSVAVLVLFR